MDSDRVLVMDRGTVVECDTPGALLENKHSFFYGLVHSTRTKDNWFTNERKFHSNFQLQSSQECAVFNCVYRVFTES